MRNSDNYTYDYSHSFFGGYFLSKRLYCSYMFIRDSQDTEETNYPTNKKYIKPVSKAQLSSSVKTQKKNRII